MNSDRIKEIQMATAYPDSQSVQQALLQVWNECQQERMYSEEEVLELLTQRCKHFGTNVSPFNKLLLKQDLEWFEQNKKK